MPWKNGGGFTTEIAIGPEGAALDQFDWRVSMAEIMTDGPFSSFAGIDRTLSILEGNGIRLTVGGETTVLTRESAPFGFPGDAATSAILVDGPVIDLNVMTRRGVIEHRVTRLEEPVAISGCRMTPIRAERRTVDHSVGCRVRASARGSRRAANLGRAGATRATPRRGGGAI